jgi:single-strand DNA-binding protein
MPSLNVCHLIGNLTRDPELRVTPNGSAICQFGLAINRTFKDGAGQQREEVTFLDVEAWGKQAEVIAKYCTKGRALYVQGRLKLDQWEDKTTQQKRTKVKVVLENFQFLGGKDDAPPQDQAESPPRRQSPAPQPTQSHDQDDDVPF